MKDYRKHLTTKTLIRDQSLLRHEDIKQSIRVMPVLQAYIPALQTDEWQQLEANILKDGCREALLVWETTEATLESTSPDPNGAAYVLIDGHNRYAICQKHGLDYRIHLVHYPSLEAVKAFMIDNQLGRRNLTPEQASYLRGLKYLTEKGQRGKYDRSNHKGQIDPYETESDLGSGLDAPKPDTTSARLAKQFGVGVKTIKRDGAYAAGLEKLTPRLKTQVLSGQIKVNKAVIQQLAQQEIQEGSLDSVAAIQKNSTAVELNQSVAPVSKADESRAQLTQHLTKLVEQLGQTRTDAGILCDEIIETATKIKATVGKL